MRLNNEVVTRQERGRVSFSPLESWGNCSPSFLVLMGIHLDKVICLLHPNFFVKVFFIGPPGGKELSTAVILVIEDSQLPCPKIKREELWELFMERFSLLLLLGSLFVLFHANQWF